MAPPRPPPADLAAEMEQLRAQLAELHQQQMNAQTTNSLLEQLVQNLNTGKKSKIWVDKPERFNGKIGDSVENWLNGWELWFKHREKQDGPEEERTKIETAMQCTTTTVQSALARHERKNGRWATWDSFQKYMKAKYTSTDSGFARYLKLKQVIQKDGETVESFYQRFDEHISRQKEDDEAEAEAVADRNKKVNSHHNYMFVDNLNVAIKSAFLRLPEAKDFQKRTLYELRGLATRVEESVSHARYSKPTASSQSGNHGGNKPSKKFQKSRDTDELSREKLTNNERSFLTSNIQRGGGAYIYPNVQKKWDWIKWARKERVCVKCASKNHLGDTCSAQVKDTDKGSDHSHKSGGKNGLHAMITAMEAEEAGHSEMNPDTQYLCSVPDKSRKDLSLMMYNCEVNDSKGITLGDPGATLVYINTEYARRSNVRFLEKTKSRTVSLPNGTEMKILGHCEFLMTMGEWSGWVQATILDMKAEFDVILGLSWYRQWKPIPDWETLDMLVSTPEGVKKIQHKLTAEMEVPKRPRLTVMQEYRKDLQFNLITEKEAKCGLMLGPCYIL